MYVKYHILHVVHTFNVAHIRHGVHGVSVVLVVHASICGGRRGGMLELRCAAVRHDSLSLE